MLGRPRKAKDHERQVKELLGHLSQIQSQRDDLKRDEARADLRTAVSSRAQAEKRLAGAMLKA
jgi:hypothetical protein